MNAKLIYPIEAGQLIAHAIHVSNLEVRVEQVNLRLLSETSFTVGKGHFLGVIGASGCGKSTLLKSLSGQGRPTSGRVLLGGHLVLDLQENLPLVIGFLPQFGAFHVALSVREIQDFNHGLRG